MLDFTVQALSAGLLFVGLWLMGDKRLLGPALCCLAEMFCVVVGVVHDVWSLVLIGMVLFLVQLRNFVKWSNEGSPW